MSTTSIQDKTRAGRPRYGMWNDTGFMLRMAWTVAKSVPFICVILAVSTAGATTVELFVAPTVLGVIETHAPLGTMLAAIAGFTVLLLALNGIHSYFDTSNIFGRIEVRVSLLEQVGRKMADTSFPNTLDAKFQAAAVRARDNCDSNWAPTEKFWATWTDILTNVIGFIAYLTVLSGLNAGLIVLVIVTTAISYASGSRINEWGYRHRDEYQVVSKRLDYAYSLAQQREYAKDIRLFGMRSWIAELRDGALRTLHAFLAKREGIYMVASAIDVALAFARNGVAYVYLIWLTLAQGLPASRFLLYFTAVSGFTTWVTGILDKCSELHKESLELSSLREFVEWPEPFTFEGGKALEADVSRPYEIRLDHVSFRYPGADRETLHDIDLTIRSGENLAVVGLNGAGKTTLIRLICGFLDPTEGRVLLNGEDIRVFDRRDYYRLFAAVFQDFSVLESTVAQNVAQRVDGIDAARVRRCLDEAGLSEKIDSLPDGIDAHIGRQVYEDGVELSGGQTQRLMLARALYRNAPVLLLDEPTAALDPIAENDIYQRYHAMTAGRTSVFISHRLASTRFCDRILFMKDGRIAEEGTHDELLAAGGGYAELFEVQSRYYRDADAGSAGADEFKGSEAAR